ncbi:shikimate dehydrogenase [Tianweitania sediminis]|uniref:Shikimate dehydrogenase (NADP(+)) n=1 Tax=Tianweitania sediminis TaxID=1502156 RepID=A0A8J7QYF2_9HYPH|nr:shikimate dehydrogenase [Tianweitania sediminis]MBP0437522.1 shikimate dehydrogenase [Tianweitania sediminis]
MADAAGRAFVCGFPLAHSRSPVIHRHWLREHGLSGSYDPVEVAPERFPTFVSELRDQGFVGGNVTIPHKEQAFRLVAKRTEEAEAIGAVNTLWFEGDVLVGGNTDAYGFGANLDERAPGWQRCNKAVVLGAGGASRAVLYALLQRGVGNIRLVNRTLERAQALANHFGTGVTAVGWDDADAQLEDAGLLVNTTSLGMNGSSGPQIDLSRLPETAVVTDIVYVPLHTPLLQDASARGLRAVDGLGMLLHQAVPGFERWFGVRPVVSDALRARVIADLGGQG